MNSHSNAIVIGFFYFDICSEIAIN